MNGLKDQSEAGYVLLDVLVGVAIAGIVILFATSAFRQTQALQTRLEREATQRQSVISTLRVVGQQLETLSPSHSLSVANATRDGSSLRFTGSLPGPSRADFTVEGLFANGLSQSGERQFVLALTRDDIGQRSSVLLGRDFIASFAISAHEGRPIARSVLLTIQQKQPARTITVPFQIPEKPRVICIAAPFEPSCRT